MCKLDSFFSLFTKYYAISNLLFDKAISKANNSSEGKMAII